MPAAPKLSQSKKASANKSKGAVRAKTGCYTCRIRRKKCDEERTDRETCKTCERLRLECLGFGAKRPEWLRENRNVVALRDQIKVFLASQGLIKGHSGTGPRPPDAGPQILRLTNPSEHQGAYHDSDSDSQQARSLSMSDDDDLMRRHMTSSIRDQPAELEPAWFGPGGMNSYTQMPHLHMHQHQLRRSPSPYSSNSYDDDQHNRSSRTYPSQHLQPPQQPPPQQQQQHHHNMPSHPYSLSPSSPSLDDPSSLISPAIASRFGHLYTDHINLEPNGYDANHNALALVPTANHTLMNPMGMPELHPLRMYQPMEYVPVGLVDDSVRAYVLRIAEIQFLLGDRAALPDLIWESCQTHNTSQKALSLLTSIYYRRQQHPNQAVLTNSEMHTQLRSLLEELNRGNLDDPDDAIAALHGVSMFLFDGGHGAWLQFLMLATEYVKKVLHSPMYSNPRDALLYANPKDAFIVKTAIWFDALGSITTSTPPRFLEEVRQMFGPDYRGVYDPSFDNSPQCSMLSPMGCENRVLWALAEVSALAAWKDSEKRNRRLNIMELVQKATDIEQYLFAKPFESRMGDPEDKDMEQIRFLASEIFRNSARLFLATVVNDDYPQVRKIQELVDEVVKCFGSLFSPGVDLFAVSRQVVRSTVFAVYIAGAMTNNPAHKEALLGHLDRECNGRKGEGVGNCASIRRMLVDVWREVAANPGEPVPWRAILKDRQILLV